MDVYEKLEQLGLKIGAPIAKGGVFSVVRFFGENLAYVSGTGPNPCERSDWVGRLGADYMLEEGQKAARAAAMNMVTNLHYELGDLNRIKSFVKLLVFVNSSPDFYEQPLVANGASQLLCDIFGEDVGLAARSAIGSNVLPGNITVEIEVLIELKS